MPKHNWRLIRICGWCGKEFEQDIDNYLRLGLVGSMKLVIPELVLSQKWACSGDCQYRQDRQRQVIARVTGMKEKT